ncbi:hypothetical protein ACBY01_14915 [Sphingomonas sp. ac-8]|uniref:hypothetical protein n=1 Tax=Sphingomonas sp. ac-8 TaxID=3242977 RepID=UPI003A7F9046
MTTPLRHAVADMLAVEVRPEIVEAAAVVAERLGGVAVLFYGSVLRTGDLDGLLDFYVLTDRAPRRAVSRWLWPDISFEEAQVGGLALRAKVATMPLAVFAEAATGALPDTTIWTRFVQPSALLYIAGAAQAEAVVDAIAAATVTAARFAAVLGPAHGTPADYWKALFRETYRAELRVERPGREDQILAYDPARYAALLPLAWDADRLPYRDSGRELTPLLPPEARAGVLRQWRSRRRTGKPLNALRLVKAAFLLDGAARYGAWKVERHTGVPVKLTPWAERHPLLAAPGVLWRVWRARAQA